MSVNFIGSAISARLMCRKKCSAITGWKRDDTAQARGHEGEIETPQRSTCWSSAAYTFSDPGYR